ncbi:MAG TPA: BON domain-containing protein [Vicinamibacterales bacterium]|nr:BON domain-containing protein [Vicinamibacterales bacterium]
MAKRYEDRYGRGSHRRDREYADDRGYMDRASDEVRSWFGDDEAERRRRMDEQRDREQEPRYRAEPRRGDWTRSEWHRGDQDRPDWNRSDYRPSDWGRTWAASDWDRDRARRDREWSSPEDDWSARSAPVRRGGAWSADEGRMEFGETQRWGRGPKGYQRPDTRIHEEVCDRLTYSDVDAENIEVTVTSAEVTLSGTVRDRRDKRRAEDLAEEVSGVRDVHNNIRVHRPERGIGQSESSASDQPGSVLGVNPTAEPSNTRRRS